MPQLRTANSSSSAGRSSSARCRRRVGGRKRLSRARCRASTRKACGKRHWKTVGVVSAGSSAKAGQQGRPRPPMAEDEDRWDDGNRLGAAAVDRLQQQAEERIQRRDQRRRRDARQAIEGHGEAAGCDQANPVAEAHARPQVSDIAAEALCPERNLPAIQRRLFGAAEILHNLINGRRLVRGRRIAEIGETQNRRAVRRFQKDMERGVGIGRESPGDLAAVALAVAGQGLDDRTLASAGLA